jgi:hypothetical protein
MTQLASYALIVGFGAVALGAIALLVVGFVRRNSVKPSITNSFAIKPLLWAPGTFTLLAGALLLAYDVSRYRAWGVSLFCAGWLILFGAILLNAATARRKRKTWRIVAARCTKQLLHSTWMGSSPYKKRFPWAGPGARSCLMAPARPTNSTLPDWSPTPAAPGPGVSIIPATDAY